MQGAVVERAGEQSQNLSGIIDVGRHKVLDETR